MPEPPPEPPEDEPTQVFPAREPDQPTEATVFTGPPTEPAAPPAGPPAAGGPAAARGPLPPPPPLGPPPPAFGSGRGPGPAAGRSPNPWIIAIGLAAVAIVVAAVALILVNRGSGNRSSAAVPPTVAPTTSTSALPSVAPTTATTLAGVLPSLPTSTTTSTTVFVAGNRDPSPAERQQIETDDNPGPNATIDTIKIADSDATWALDHISPVAGHERDIEPAYHILHRASDQWTIVSQGSAQVACDPSVPSNVAADFSDILGSCPSH